MKTTKFADPLVSVIVPVYCVEQYLDRCIRSIISQTYKNLEIILVDDGSPDDSGEMCEEYASRDSRIKVIHKENGGLSDARNVAIDMSTGDYLLCVDSDDYIHHSLVTVLYDSLKKNNADISVVGHIDVDETQKPDLAASVANSSEVLDTQCALEKMLYQQEITNSAWSKLYKSELFSTGTRYPKGKLCEDLDTTYKLFAESKKTVLNSAKLYYYLKRESSIINTTFMPARLDALEFAENQLLFVQREFPAIERAAQNRLFMEAVFIITNMTRSGIPSNRVAWQSCAGVIRRQSASVLSDAKSPVAYRCYGLAGLISPRLIFTINGVKNIVKKMRRNL